MPVSMNAIPDDIRVPLAYVEFDNTKALSGAGNLRYKLLAIGQRLTTGEVAAGVPTRIFSPEHAEQAFGLGSQLAEILSTFKRINNGQEIWAIALNDDAEGTAAAGLITFAVGGGGLSVGSLTLYIGGTRVRLSVTSADTASTLATRLIAAINGNPRLPVTAAAVEGEPAQVALAARHKGECGNDIDVRLNYYPEDRTPKGLTVTIGAMADGAGNPDLTVALAAMGEQWWMGVINPYTDDANLALLNTELTTRWGPVSMKDARSWMGYRGTLGETLAFGADQNCIHFTFQPTGASPTSPWVAAAILCAVCSPELERDPARPVHNLPLPGMLAPKMEERWNFYERNQLLWDGISSWKVAEDGTCWTERVITSYQTNALGAEDPSYLDVETPATLSFLRYSVVNTINLRFPRHKLRADPEAGSVLPEGQPIVTPSLIRKELVSLFRDWEEAGLCEGVTQFAADLQVEIDADNPNRVNVLMGPNLVNQFRFFAAQIQFRL